MFLTLVRFIEYVNASHDSITDVKKAGAVLLNAFEYAHNSIMEGKLAFWDAGTTTLLGGILLEINKTVYPDVSSLFPPPNPSFIHFEACRTGHLAGNLFARV